MDALESVATLVDLVRSNPETCRWTGGLTPEDISGAEAELAAPFPPSYRRYLAELGSCEVDGVEFLSIRQTVRETLEARVDLDLPPGLLVIEFDGMGGLVSLDTTASATSGADHEAPVVAWGGCAHNGNRPEPLAPNFGTYAVEKATRALSGSP